MIIINVAQTVLAENLCYGLGADLHTDAGLRDELKHQIKGLSDESMKKLWEAIQCGVFGAPLETGS